MIPLLIPNTEFKIIPVKVLNKCLLKHLIDIEDQTINSLIFLISASTFFSHKSSIFKH